MKGLHTLALAMIVSAMVALSTGCDSSVSSPQPVDQSVHVYQDLNASFYDQWKYFSLEKNDLVIPQNPRKDLQWDIAFHRQDIRVNASEYFIGHGGIYKTDSKDFEKVELSDLKGDYMGNSRAKRANTFDHKGTTYVDDYYVTTGASNEYTTFNFDMEAHNRDNSNIITMFPIVENVYLIRSADGKHVYKLQITSSVGSRGTRGGYLNFKYRQLQ